MVMLKNWSLFTFGRERGHGSAKPPNPPSQAICDFAIHERSQLQFHEHRLRDPEPSSHHTLPYFFPACRLLHWILNWPRQARWYLSLAGWSPTCAVPLALGRQYLFGARLLSVLQETSHVAAIHSEAPTPLENLNRLHQSSTAEHRRLHRSPGPARQREYQKCRVSRSCPITRFCHDDLHRSSRRHNPWQCSIPSRPVVSLTLPSNSMASLIAWVGLGCDLPLWRVYSST
jgi:hypothetical protein